MRRTLLAPAVLIALLAQPALPAWAHGDEAPAFDPLRVARALYLDAHGALSDQAPAAGSVPAPQSLPGSPGIAVWARDLPAGQLRGLATLTLKAELDLPASAPPTAGGLFNVSLLRGSTLLASAEQGPVLATPGPVALTFKLGVDDAPFQAGDGLVLQVAFEGVSAGTVPTVRYDIGPGGSVLQLAEELASLDGLGHAHAPGDQHFLQSAYRMRLGDLGQGRWGAHLELGGAPVALRVPAGTARLLLQMDIDPDLAAPPDSVALDLPGGRTTVYRGEVVVRELAPADGAAVRTADGAAVATFQVQAATPPPDRSGPGEALQRDALRAAGSPAGGDDQAYILVLALPALLMLGGVMLHAMRREMRPDAAPARKRARAQVRAPSRSIKPARPLQPQRR